MSKQSTDFNFGQDQSDFVDQIAKTFIESAAETGEYRGCGGHGLQNHGGHGEHTQISIGIGNQTVNIRQQS